MATYSNAGGPVTKKPKKAGIIWAVAIFVVTAIIGIVLVAISIGVIANAIDDLAAVDAGETREVTLKPGDQYIFVGADTQRELAQVRVEVVDENGDVPVLNDGNDYTADNDDLAFESIGYIDVDTTTTYTVTVAGPPESTVRIGTIPIGTFLGLLIGGIAIGTIGFLVALVIFIVALVRRSRVKKENRAAAWAGPGGPAYPQPYGQTPGQPYGQPAPGPYPQPYGTTAPPPAAPGPPPAAPPAPTPPPAAPPAPTPPAPTPPPAAPPATPPPPPGAPTMPPPGAPPTGESPPSPPN